MDNYFDAPGLSNSGMKDLAVSPLRYWYLHVNPERPVVEPTPEMQVGSALHCAILEPAAFNARYACEMIPPAGALDTMEDLRGFLRENGQTPKGTRKAEAIAQVQAFAPLVPIVDVLTKQHAEQHADKVIFPVESWLCIGGAAQALRDEPRVNAILEGVGKPEQPIFMKDPATGVLLKGKLDWLAPILTLDLKTFNQKRGKSIDRSVADAIFYEQYYRQAYFYGLLRGWPRNSPVNSSWRLLRASRHTKFVFACCARRSAATQRCTGNGRGLRCATSSARMPSVPSISATSLGDTRRKSRCWKTRKSRR